MIRYIRSQGGILMPGQVGSKIRMSQDEAIVSEETPTPPPDPFEIADLGDDVVDYWDIQGTMSLSGINVATWTSSLGNLTQFTMTNGPYRFQKINSAWTSGLAGLHRQDAASYTWMEAIFAAGKTFYGPFTWYFLYKGLTSSILDIFGSRSATGYQPYLTAGTTGGQVYYNGGINIPAGLSTGEYVWCVVANAANSAVYVNDEKTAFATGAFGNNTREIKGFCLGQNNFRPEGYYGDVLICRSAHDEATRTKVMTFLRNKFIA